MTEEELAQRQRYVEAAKEYIGTPYHHMGRLKGSGVDCATLLACAAVDSKTVETIELDYYARHWHLHRGSEQYLHVIAKWCKEVSGDPIVGDIVLWKFARSFSHAAIVIEWPIIVHAFSGRPVCIDNVTTNPTLKFVGESRVGNRPRPMKVLTFHQWTH